MVCNRAIDEKDFARRVELMSRDKEWGDDLELFAIEEMSRIKIIVYEQVLVNEKLIGIKCSKGYFDLKDRSNVRIALLMENIQSNRKSTTIIPPSKEWWTYKML